MKQHLLMVIYFILTFSLGLPQLAAAQSVISGYVFEDENRNGIFDTNEKGIPGVAVSNQQDVVQTALDGRYTLPVLKKMIIFISKPTGYDTPLNEDNIPQFYHIHHPEGSPDYLKYSGIKPTGPLPEQINFPLHKTQAPTNNFNALITGDPQPRDSAEVGYFRDDIIANMIGRDARFYMALGDIAFDNLNTFRQYNGVVSRLDLPAYNVPGNHDSNFRSRDDAGSMETFKSVYGPSYYSFNYGKVHFIILDDVEYFGWDTVKNKYSGYRGYISEQQLNWLKNDLQFVPEDHLIVMNMHIPIYTEYSESPGVNVVNRDALFDILQERKYLLALSAHIHFIEILDFDEKTGWKGKHPFRSINAAAGCGAWWSGPKNSAGIPVSYCMDGTPNGYFIFNFSGNQYNYRYHPAKFDAGHQMHISRPQGVLDEAALDTTRIIVNIFAADPETEVFCQVDKNQRLKMKRHIGKDPFITDYLKNNADSFPGWIDNEIATGHLWIADLPENLSPGTHLIKVSARDSKGNLYSGVRLFDIKEAK